MHCILFLLSMSEDEWQEDSCDDCHQVVRMGAESCLDLHGVRLNRCRELFCPSFYSSGRRRRFVGAFAGAAPPHPDFLFFP